MFANKLARPTNDPEMPNFLHTIRGRYCGGLITLTYYTGVFLGSVAHWKANLPTHGDVHMPLHVGTYLVTALVTLVFAPWRANRVASCIMPVTLAFVTETLQCYVYGISFEWQDIVADLYGVLTGALLFMASQHVRVPSKRRAEYD